MPSFTVLFFVCLFVFRDRVSLWLLEAVLELALVEQAGLDSQRSTCLCLPSAGVKGERHQRLATVLLMVDTGLKSFVQTVKM
ncbi:hypothetical protein I79_001910 [Cricetulus griseus]|uniref:Secreted protein n=1 Tax=Cricetulus griseus TaxID=10029 RepID=G3GW04_CRIGR|nr:hypothetical protein I79_001910 [Cricetulus griseus]